MTAAVMAVLVYIIGMGAIALIFPVKLDRFFQKNDAEVLGYQRKPVGPWPYRVMGVASISMPGAGLWQLGADLYSGDPPDWNSQGMWTASGDPNYYLVGFMAILLAMGLPMVLIPGRVIPKGWRAAAVELDNGGSWRVLQWVYRAFGMVFVLMPVGTILKVFRL